MVYQQLFQTRMILCVFAGSDIMPNCTFVFFSERDESDDENAGDDDSDNDDDDIPYNPKNLPLGWDGKVYRLFVLMYSCSFAFLSH